MADDLRAAAERLAVEWRAKAERDHKHGDCYRIGRGWGLVDCADDLQALLDALAAAPRHAADCELRRGHTIIYPELPPRPSLTEVLAMEHGRLAKGIPDADLTSESRRPARCTCGLAAAPRISGETEHEAIADA
jgi:hypothetical protein